MSYITSRDFSHVRGLQGISDKQIEQHIALYNGYVTQTNLLFETLSSLSPNEFNTPIYNELKRRFGWELNGAKLHEYYFDNLNATPSSLDPESELARAITERWGSYESWRQDFIATGMIRGIGWVILYQDIHTGKLNNQWITEHECNHFPHGHPLLVMDVWEHAYIGDYLATERKKYIESYMNNIFWQKVMERFNKNA
jgi:Fe-Mn family superoxide dismutase